MFHSGMILLFNTRSGEDLRKEAELLAELHPGCLADLVDDILIPGISPPRSAALKQGVTGHQQQ